MSGLPVSDRQIGALICGMIIANMQRLLICTQSYLNSISITKKRKEKQVDRASVQSNELSYRIVPTSIFLASGNNTSVRTTRAIARAP